MDGYYGYYQTYDIGYYYNSPYPFHPSSTNDPFQIPNRNLICDKNKWPCRYWESLECWNTTWVRYSTCASCMVSIWSSRFV